MPDSISTGRKQETISKFQAHKTDTGSPEVQVALLSERVSHLTEHLKRTTTGDSPQPSWSLEDGRPALRALSTT